MVPCAVRGWQRFRGGSKDQNKRWADVEEQKNKMRDMREEGRLQRQGVAR